MLQNFRVFSGTKEISFLNSTGYPFDFICIYGPNGSGKTTIVDALEWAVTGRLHRFEKEMGDQGKIYSGSILANFNSDKSANVQIEAVNQILEIQSFGRKTFNRKNSNNDYRAGRPNGQIFLREQQILPHSKIASFISATRPTDRLMEWSRFSGSHNDFPLLGNMFRLRKKLLDSLETAKENLETATKNVESCYLDSAYLDKVNQMIEDYQNKQTFLPLSLPAVSKINAEISQKLDFDSLSSAKHKLLDHIELLQKRLNIFRVLLQKYPIYMKAIEQKKAYQSTLLNCAKYIKNALSST